MDGILRCSRYAFGPNRLHYCGPDANSEIKAYIDNGVHDPGLEAMLRGFRTMYPYLKLIAEANRIRDPFDDRVVEAYWIGNRLLEEVERKALYFHLEEQGVKDRIGSRSFSLLEDKIRHGAVPHHSFHVLDIWKRTGNLEHEHTLESMDSCRISWGKVLAVDGPKITIETEPLVLLPGNSLALGAPTRRTVTRALESRTDIEQLAPGNLVTVHWSVPCEAVTEDQVSMLRKYTLRHIALANQTL